MIDQETHAELQKIDPRDLTDDQLTIASRVGGVDFAALVESLRRSRLSNEQSSRKMVWLSVAMIFLALAQVVAAIIPLLKHP